MSTLNFIKNVRCVSTGLPQLLLQNQCKGISTHTHTHYLYRLCILKLLQMRQSWSFNFLNYVQLMYYIGDAISDGDDCHVFDEVLHKWVKVINYLDCNKSVKIRDHSLFFTVYSGSELRLHSKLMHFYARPNPDINVMLPTGQCHIVPLFFGTRLAAHLL